VHRLADVAAGLTVCACGCWQLFWPMVQHSLRQSLGPQLYTDEVDDAWKAVFAHVISKMRDGIRTQQQQQQQHESSAAALSSASYSSIIL